VATKRTEREWADLDARYDVMKRQTGWDTAHIGRELGLSRQTLSDRLQRRLKQGTLPDDVNPWLGESAGTPNVHQGTPEHQGTLEEYQEVMEEVHQSVPDVPHLGTDEVHLSTPEVHPGRESGGLKFSTLWCSCPSRAWHQHTYGTPWHTDF
jgi:hypothetical protein